MAREEVLKGLVVGGWSSSEATKEESRGEASVLLLPGHPTHLEVELLQPLVAFRGRLVEPEEKLGPTPND